GEVVGAPVAEIRGGRMTIVRVTTPGGDYPIHIEPGRLERLAETIPADATSIAMVSNPVVLGKYGEAVRQALASTGKPITEVVLPDGEANKNWQSLNMIFDHLLQNGLDRKAVLVAFRSEEHTSELQSRENL